MSDAARVALDGSVPKGLHIKAHGQYRLRGIEEPLAIFQIGAGDAAFEPPADADKAYRVVRAGDVWVPVREVRHNLIPERDAFVGRVRELAELSNQLDGISRLITLIGPGGAGKTRMAVRYARSRLGDWVGGIYFCDLSEARTLEGIQFAVAQALAVPLGKDDPTQQLGNAIAGRGRCLVILDNCEQVIDFAAGTLGRWLDLAPAAAFVATSRERLRLTGEQVVDVQPLRTHDEAIELFAVRARAVLGEFVVDDVNREPVRRVVEMLDGMPLAVELAAARSRTLTPQMILQRLQDRFKLLIGARGTTSRQATLKAAIDWSWSLLPPWEQAAFAQCAAFSGGFTLAAAEAVVDLSQWPEAPSTLDVVNALVDKSLLRSNLSVNEERRDSEEARFTMYLSIHEYAHMRLKDLGGTRLVEQAHGAHFARLGSDESIEALSRHGGALRRRRLIRDLDNLVSACSAANPRSDLPVATHTFLAIAAAVDLHGPLSLGLELGQQVEAMFSAEHPSRAPVLSALGKLAYRSGKMQQADQWLAQASDLARSIGDRRGEIAASSLMGVTATFLGRIDAARARLDSAMQLAKSINEPHLLGAVFGHMGLLHLEEGKVHAAQTCYQSAIELGRAVGDSRSVAINLANLGLSNIEQGQFEPASKNIAESTVMYRELGDQSGVANNAINLGKMLQAQGRLAQAQSVLEAALITCRQLGERNREATARANLGVVCVRRADLAGARSHCLASLEIYRETGNLIYEGYATFNLAELDGKEGHYAQAIVGLEACLQIFHRVGGKRLTAVTLRELASVLLKAERLAEAQTQLHKAMEILESEGDIAQITFAQCVRARMLMKSGDTLGAEQQLKEVHQALRDMGPTAELELIQAVAELDADFGVNPVAQGTS